MYEPLKVMTVRTDPVRVKPAKPNKLTNAMANGIVILFALAGGACMAVGVCSVIEMIIWRM